MKGVSILAGVAGLLLVIQLVPVERRNPPATSTVEAPPGVDRVLRRACFDCHSNETVWPPYAGVAPFSWLVAHDVKEGREELNFSTWGPAQSEKAAKKLGSEVEKGDMPPALYRLVHPEAKLTPEEKALLSEWAAGLR
jgi:hypothetical protein